MTKINIYHAKSIEEAVDNFESFLVSDVWYASKSEWKKEEDAIKYIRNHFDILRNEIKLVKIKMKNRTCDKCKKEITGEFVKCCLSKMENGVQKLNHVGDICKDCWKEISK